MEKKKKKTTSLKLEILSHSCGAGSLMTKICRRHVEEKMRSCTRHCKHQAFSLIGVNSDGLKPRYFGPSHKCVSLVPRPTAQFEACGTASVVDGQFIALLRTTFSDRTEPETALTMPEYRKAEVDI